jgi:hypothetical protein
MNNRKQFQKQINQNIKLATNLKRAKFGNDICKRLYTEYKRTAEQSFLPGIEVLENCLNLFDIFLNFNSLDDEKILDLINEVEIIKPVTDSLTESEAIYAINTIDAFRELLMFLSDEDADHIITLSELMTKCIESQILENNEQMVYDEVDNNPMLINEFNHQLEVIK